MFPDDITLALFHNGFSIEDCNYVKTEYMDTEIETLDMVIELDPSQLNEKILGASSEKERRKHIEMLGISLMVMDGLEEQNKSGIIDVPTNICVTLLNKVSKQYALDNLDENITKELDHRFETITKKYEDDIRCEATVVQYKKVHTILTKQYDDNVKAITLALLKNDVSTYIVYTIIDQFKNPTVQLSRELFHKICKLSL